MLRINRSMMAALDASASRRYAAELSKQLYADHRDALADLGIDAGHFGDYVARGLETAATLGITRRADVRRYLEIPLVLGPEPDFLAQYTWIRDILDDGLLDGHEKVASIYGDLTL